MTMPLRALWGFCIHVLTGGVLFCLVAVGAFAIHLLADVLEREGLPAFPSELMRVFSFIVFGLDVLSYAWFLMVVFVRVLKDPRQGVGA